MKRVFFSNYSLRDLCIVLLLVMCSGTVVFNIKYNNIFIPFVLVISIAFSYLKKNMRLSYENGMKLLVIVSFILVNTFIHTNSGVAYNAVVQFIFYLVSTCFVFNYLSFKKYKMIFVDIVSVLALISEVIFVGARLGIVTMHNELINGKSYVMALGHVLGWAGNFFQNRMCGLFHEPGMYQIILNMALLFLLDELLVVPGFRFSAKQKIQLVLLGIGVLWTRSTSGYIVLAVLIIYFLLLKRKTVIGKTQKRLYSILLPFIILVCAFLIVQNSVIIDKFQVNNISFSTRTNDLLGSLEMLKVSPLIGYGIGSKYYLSNLIQVGITSQSNDWLAVSLTLGIPFIVLYIVFMITNIRKKQEWTIGIIPILIMIVVQGVTEGCLFFPIMLAFIFGRDFGREKQK